MQIFAFVFFAATAAATVIIHGMLMFQVSENMRHIQTILSYDVWNLAKTMENNIEIEVDILKKIQKKFTQENFHSFYMKQSPIGDNALECNSWVHCVQFHSDAHSFHCDFRQLFMDTPTKWNRLFCVCSERSFLFVQSSIFSQARCIFERWISVESAPNQNLFASMLFVW